MSRYYSARRRGPTKPKEQTPAIWRGIGCLLVLIVPGISWVFAAGTVGLALRDGWPLPYQLLGYPVMPAELWKIPGFPPILFFLERQPNLYMTVVFTVAYTVVISALLSAGYSFVYRIVGPPRLGPYDVPQPQIKVGRYKR